MDGVHFVRAGHQWTVHLRAFIRYRQKLATAFDVVIDEVNTVPFFTPLWARTASFMLMFQLARQVWWYESAFPVSAIGYVLEPVYLRLYRKIPVLTISRSTADDLRKLGFASRITVLPIAVQAVRPATVAKSEEPTFIYVGRITPSKRVTHLVRALAIFQKELGSGELWIVGDGQERHVKSVRRLAERLGVTSSVRLFGHLSDDEKHRKMAQAHALLMASVREGWGLVVTEANVCGTPAVVYDVAGLRDAVRHEKTGLVVSPSYRHLAAGMLRLWRDRPLMAQMTREATEWSRTFSADRTGRLAESIIASETFQPSRAGT
jgi:glycosyltransferase involved in cell wall biosynthesis